MSQTIRIAVVQTKRRTIPYKAPFKEAVEQLHHNLDALTHLAIQASEKGCDIVAFPEDTLGTLEWEAGHWSEMTEFLDLAQREMLIRFGEVAASKGIAIICSNDCAADAHIYNTAILLGRDGREIGRYAKVQLPLPEQGRTRGQAFPVFDVPGIGTLGMAICYDMVFPETTRILALSGADIVFHLTLGGASMAGQDASLAAFRTRAADNFIYLAVAFRSGAA
jgi:predicted amidohydrolase